MNVSRRDVYVEELCRSKSRRTMQLTLPPQKDDDAVAGMRQSVDDGFGNEERSKEQQGCRRAELWSSHQMETGWRELVTRTLGFDEDDEYDSDDDDEHGHLGNIPFYAPPMQRQRWGEDQILPHINWGDIFFDLFYVAAAYNLSALLISSLTPGLYLRGILYFVGIFGPLFNMWEGKLVYDARYSVVDYAHRVGEIVRTFFLSFSVLHIKPLDLMSDPTSSETFFFTLGLFLEIIVRILLKVELVCVGKGDVEAIRNHSKRKLVVSYIPLAVFYLAAVIVSAVEHFGRSSSNHGDYDKAGYDGKSDYDKAGYGETEAGHDKDTHDDGHFRFLAASDSAPHGTSAEGWRIGDLPIALCALSYLLNTAFTALRKAFILPKMEDFRRYNVPINIDFSIHRYGEWVMLMLGEVVLSLLIVETTESNDYYFVAIVGALTVIMLQALHFESEPSHADHHALWRNMTAGMVYSNVLQLLSMGLIAFGVSYKVMLQGIHEKVEKGNSDYDRKRLLLETFAPTEQEHRYLAPSISVKDKGAAALFCSSLFVVLISLELLTNTHRGWMANYKRIFKTSGNQSSLRLEPLLLAAFKLLLLLFTVTLSQWLTDPKWITLTGFFAVVTVAGTRVIGWKMFHRKKCRKKKVHAKGKGTGIGSSESNHFDVNNGEGVCEA